MAVFVVGFLLILAMAGYSDASYCVCNTGVSDSVLQKNIDYACGAGADCVQIQQNGPCYNPNTVRDHCNYAVNSYYQRKGQTAESCVFSGTTTVLQAAPTSTCSAGSSTGGTPTTGTPTTGTPTTGTPTTGTPTTGTPIGGTPNMGGSTTMPGSSMTPPFGLGPTGSGFPSSTDNSAGLKLESLNVLVSMSVFVISGFFCSGI